MLGRLYEGQTCSAARALELVGERWSLLIIRDALFRGFTRFSDFQGSLGVASNVLAKRLEGFVAAGILELKDADYVTTEKGLELKPIIIALTAWGDRWVAPGVSPVAFEHAGCGGRIKAPLLCSKCGEVSDTTDVVRRKPGSSKKTKKATRSSRSA